MLPGLNISWECLRLSQVCSCSAEFPPCARDVVQTHQTMILFLKNCLLLPLKHHSNLLFVLISLNDNFPVPLFLPSLVLMVVFVLSQCRTQLPSHFWIGHGLLLQLSGAGSEQELGHFQDRKPRAKCLSFHMHAGSPIIGH